MKRFFTTLVLTLLVLNLFAWQTYQVADKFSNQIQYSARTTNNLDGCIYIVTDDINKVPKIQFSGTTFSDNITDIDVTLYCGNRWNYTRTFTNCKKINNNTYETLFPMDWEFTGKFGPTTFIKVIVYQENNDNFVFYSEVKNCLDVLQFFNIFELIKIHGNQMEPVYQEIQDTSNPPYIEYNVVDECENFTIYNLKENRTNTIDIYYEGGSLYSKMSTKHNYIDLSISIPGNFYIVINNKHKINIQVKRVLTGLNIR